jgi:molybdate transport system regulatory protein
MPMVDDLMLRVQLTKEHHLGPGKVRLLELIAELGSISAAGRAMAMSYRRAWLLIDSMNAAFRNPVITSAVGGKAGGGAVVTTFGREVIARFRRMEATTRKATAADVEALRACTKVRAAVARKASGRPKVRPPRLSRGG